jgi:hypothetical protein
LTRNGINLNLDVNIDMNIMSTNFIEFQGLF